MTNVRNGDHHGDNPGDLDRSKDCYFPKNIVTIIRDGNHLTSNGFSQFKGWRHLMNGKHPRKGDHPGDDGNPTDIDHHMDGNYFIFNNK